MEITVTAIFDAFELAEQARAALLAAGFGSEELQMNIANDEAGPVAGNFTVGNLPTQSQQHTYERNYAGVRQAAQCVLSVACGDQARAAQARQILVRSGGRDGDPAARYGL
ncbi:hypothetical protein [Massilia sp. CF038]|uniref:hypothetical protein n=1 Tax=Massilia sp. CF038 TaxID=1881045 RepID=UPI00091F72E0|nr:hypothetical protein [Massilia sp. CF038]SHG66991.1 hypothetical protein SAMN05428948_1534 [Massilia sp. CF038]